MGNIFSHQREQPSSTYRKILTFGQKKRLTFLLIRISPSNFFNLLQWFRSYLENRSLSIVIHGFCSERFNAASAVAQGSDLGALFFFNFHEWNRRMLNKMWNSTTCRWFENFYSSSQHTGLHRYSEKANKILWELQASFSIFLNAHWYFEREIWI